MKNSNLVIFVAELVGTFGLLIAATSCIVYDGISAGTVPVSEINPLAIQAMKEVDIDISDNKSKLVTNEMIEESDSVVNMGCMDKESCPALFVEEIDDWDIEDPKGKSIEDVRRIRDSIELKVKELVSNL